jgi:thymidylate synthase
MHNYLDLGYKILSKGEARQDRTGTGTISLFAEQLKFDLSDGFPAVTTKKLFYRGVLWELLWMLSGETNAKMMLDNNVHIWDEWMGEDGELGRVYGVQWRRWNKYRERTWEFRSAEDNSLSYAQSGYVDQLQGAIDEIRANPTSRRLLVSAWNPGELDEMALPPCHYAYQFYVRGDGYLDILVNQRSADYFLGLPFDIASYATLLHMVAHVTNLRPGIMTYQLGDVHIYNDHVEQVKTQLFRKPYALPQLLVNADNKYIMEIDDFKFSDFALVGYDHHPALKGKPSV